MTPVEARLHEAVFEVCRSAGLSDMAASRVWAALCGALDREIEAADRDRFARRFRGERP